jgi:hypothetical protein
MRKDRRRWPGRPFLHGTDGGGAFSPSRESGQACKPTAIISLAPRFDVRACHMRHQERSAVHWDHLRMFELLPGVGLRLPGCAGTLRLGMDERAAQWAVATVADVRDGWVCGARWAFSAQNRGLTLNAYGDTTDRHGRHQGTPGLAGIGLTRDAFTLAGPSACPVVLHGIDLFGCPTAEVSGALGDSLPPTLRLNGAGLYLTAVSVHAEPAPVEG